MMDATPAPQMIHFVWWIHSMPLHISQQKKNRKNSTSTRPANDLKIRLSKSAWAVCSCFTFWSVSCVVSVAVVDAVPDNFGMRISFFISGVEVQRDCCSELHATIVRCEMFALALFARSSSACTGKVQENDETVNDLFGALDYANEVNESLRAANPTRKL